MCIDFEKILFSIGNKSYNFFEYSVCTYIVHVYCKLSEANDFQM